MTVCNNIHRNKRIDHYIAVALCLAILLLGLMNLDNNCNWGDDYAAYMADGIAMAEGRYDEQIKLNVVLRSGRLVDTQSEHVHVFGYPLLLALVNAFAGFDTETFSNLYLYKLPSLIAFSLMAGVYYLFLRKRLGTAVSILMTLALCGDVSLHYEIRNLGTDIAFLAFSTISFYVMEVYLDKPYGSSRFIWGVLLGFVLWYTYSVRLNGIVAAVCVFLAQAIWIYKNRKQCKLSETLPLVTFLLLFILFNLIVFPTPTSTSSASDASISSLLNGCVYYINELHQWARHFAEIVLEIPVNLAATVLYSIFEYPEICAQVSRVESFMYNEVFGFLSIIFLLFSALGIIFVGVKRDIHIVLFILASFIGTAALSLGQGLRYLFVILPFLLMYAVEGGKWLAVRIAKGKVPGRGSAVLKHSLVVLLCIFSLVPLFNAGLANLRNNNQEDLTAYSKGAIEVYNFIQEELDEEDTIAFFKPRALYINTGRVSLLPQEGGFDITDADYYLYYIPSEEFLIDEEQEELYQPCFENYEFILYKKVDK